MSHNNGSDCDPNLPFAQFVVFVVLEIISGLSAITGNAIVLLSIVRTPRLHTISNFYLASLALADFFVGLLMSPIYIALTASRLWVDTSHPLYKLENFLWIQTLVATTFNLTAVSVDRYLAVTSVFKYSEIITNRRVVLVIVFVWTMSLCFATLTLVITTSEEASWLWVSCLVMTVLVPTAIITFCYYHIFKVAKSQIRKMNNAIPNLQNVESMKNRKTAFTVAIIIGLFLAMFLPNLVFSLVEMAIVEHCRKMVIYRQWLWAIFVMFANSACNPWIYALRMNEFKAAFRRILWGRRTKRVFVFRAAKTNMAIDAGSSAVPTDIALKLPPF